MRKSSVFSLMILTGNMLILLAVPLNDHMNLIPADPGISACKIFYEPGIHAPGNSIEISEEIWKDSPHFKVETPSVTWYIEKMSGGCSSLIDTRGRDWIAFKKTGDHGPANSADSDFRGLPNLVFRDPGNGIGHPGFDVCTTIRVATDELLVCSRDGKWQFRWIFHDQYAEIAVEKTDTSRNYWFLYEGPAGGSFSPASHYWVTSSDGLRKDMPSIFKNPAGGNWHWVAFGDERRENVLFVGQDKTDTHADFFAYMGNSRERDILSEDGMNVFGFGRGENTTPLLTGQNRFFVGLYPEKLTDPGAIRTFTLYFNGIINQNQ